MKFEDHLLHALGAWQKGWRENQTLREELAINLSDAVASLPPEFKTSNGQACYRKRFLHKGELERIIMADWRDEGAVSWTLNRTFAEVFRGKLKDGAVTGAIFRRVPPDEEVLVNIPALWMNADFVRSAEAYRKRGGQHAEALFHFRGVHDQSEIVLAAPLRASEIIALTGSSSPFDDLCDMLSLPHQGRDELFKELVAQGIAINELRYVDEDQTQTIIRRTQDRMVGLVQQISANKKR
jgi:hypothetical protein